MRAVHKNATAISCFKQLFKRNTMWRLRDDCVTPGIYEDYRLSFATRFAHIFKTLFKGQNFVTHIFATGNEIQKYFSARSNSFDLTKNSVKSVLTWTRTWAISLLCALMFFVDKMSVRPPYQTVETYIVNKTAFAEFCFSKLFLRSFVSNLVAKLSGGTASVSQSFKTTLCQEAW